MSANELVWWHDHLATDVPCVSIPVPVEDRCFIQLGGKTFLEPIEDEI